MTTADGLQTTIEQMVQYGKGILAADESQPTIAKRFAAIGVEATAENVAAAQQVLLKRARLNGAAQRGEYLAAMESAN